MQLCWAEGHVPDRWKESHKVLLYKKGDPAAVGNYRPIGLLNTVYKLYTAVITDVLAEYAEARGMLSEGQEGFRQARTTARQLQVLTGVIEDSRDRGTDLLVLYVDFVNAFGSVDHRRLLATMRLLGVPEDCLAVVQDLYQGASTAFSTPHGWTAQVPFVGRGTVQGDTLSPLLFILCLEPLLRWLDEGTRGYSFGHSGERIASLAYADDLAVLTGADGHAGPGLEAGALLRVEWHGGERHGQGQDGPRGGATPGRRRRASGPPQHAVPDGAV